MTSDVGISLRTACWVASKFRSLPQAGAGVGIGAGITVIAGLFGRSTWRDHVSAAAAGALCNFKGKPCLGLPVGPSQDASALADVLQRSLWWDALLIVGYVTVLVSLLAVTAIDTRRTRRARSYAGLGLLLVAVGACADILENAGLLWISGLLGGEGLQSRAGSIALSTANVFFYWKWAALIPAALLALLLVLGMFGAGRPAASESVASSAVQRARPLVVRAPQEPADLGICVSGGGMRSATYTLGVLGQLEKTGTLSRSRWLSAVSGGAYAAGAWWLAKNSESGGSVNAGSRSPGVLTLPTPVHAPGSADQFPVPVPSLYGFMRAKRRYLSSGRGGFLFSVLMAVSLLAAHLALIYAAIFVVVRPMGWILALLPGTSGLVASGKSASPMSRTAPIPWTDVQALAIPPSVGLVVALGLLVVSLAVVGDRQILMRRLGVTALGSASVLAFFLVVLPALVAELPYVWIDAAKLLPGPDGAQAKTGFSVGLQLLGSLGITGLLFRVLARPAGRVAPKAGGVLVVLVVATVAGASLANGAWLRAGGRPSTLINYYADPLLLIPGNLRDWQRWGLGALLVAIALLVVNQRWFSLHTLYRVRLRSTFAATTISSRAASTAPGVAQFGYYPLSAKVERETLTWSKLPVDDGEGAAEPTGGVRPELLVCAAVNRQIRAGDDDPTRIPSACFVFSRDEIVWYPPGTQWYLSGNRRAAATEDWECALPGTGYRGDLATVTTAVAISGAAVASAEARLNLGTTTSLLAFLNLRLGVWLPNPARVPAPGPDRSKGFVPPRFDYFLREVFGRYDIDEDPYVYVSDGGHWENLGLVELVRRRCAQIMAFDASADKPFTFEALQSAIDLAWQECGAKIDIDLSDMRPHDGEALPKTNVAAGRITYADGKQGRLYFGKLQVAQDSGPDVRAFNQSDRVFPRYPTFNLFFRKDQVDYMALLGAEIARKVEGLTTLSSR